MGRWRQRWDTVRVRTTAAAVIAVALALLVSAVTMVVLLRRSLTADVRSAAWLRARAIANEASLGQERRVTVGDQEEEFIQIVDAGGRVVASSANVAGQPVVVEVEPGEYRQVEGLPFEDDPFVAVATSAQRPQGTLTVIVGRSLEIVTDSSEEVVGLLVGGIPLLLVVVGAMTWRGVGRALAPVESIRAEVEAISSSELHRRVPEPEGQDEIARLAATMNGMLARLEEGQARQRRFVSDASHELRSPVTTIRQHAEVALSHPESSTLEEVAETVVEEVLRLQHLVEDLLLLTKMDEGTLSLRSESVDLDDVLFEEAERLRSTTDLKVDTNGVGAGRVSGDRAQLEKLVRNLADNAARHAHRRIVFSLGEAHAEVALTIDNDGGGIPRFERKRVFERFVRLEEARDRDSGGSGLGLAIVAHIAAAHGADARVVDSALGGACFEVRFASPVE
jgi:signal transduction histidine kinase